METDLRHYVIVFKNKISQELTDEILSNLKNADFHQHKFSSLENNDDWKAVSGDKELDMAWNYRNEEVENIIRNTLIEYIKVLDFDYMKGWAGFSYPRWNKYKETRKMAPHVDLIKTLFDGERKGDPTLSVLGLLKTEFTGGEFHMINDVLTDFEPGDIVVFPSNFLYPHSVDPVTSGERYSFISWTW